MVGPTPSRGGATGAPRAASSAATECSLDRRPIASLPAATLATRPTSGNPRTVFATPGSKTGPSSMDSPAPRATSTAATVALAALVPAEMPEGAVTAGFLLAVEEPVVGFGVAGQVPEVGNSTVI